MPGSKEIIKKADSIIDIYVGKEDKRQGITRNPEVTVMQRLGTASYYTGSRQNGLTATEEQLIKQASDALKDALNTTNTFFTTEWKTYREKMEKLEVSPFKETKQFSMD